MSSKFWLAYMGFFAFVFPLFFSYMGGFTSSAWLATAALIVGLLAWMLFLRKIYRDHIALPRRAQQHMHRLLEDGKRRQGTVLDKEVVKRMPDDSESLRMLLAFPNLEGTMVQKEFELIDTKPHQKRYEKGSTVNLRLATTDEAPGVVLADAEVRFSPKLGLLLLFLALLYMVGTFIWHYAMYSNGHGWRFLSFWHPWLMTPVISLFMFGRLLSLFGGNKEKEEKLLLRGKQASARVKKADQTGTYINEQPEIRYTLAFMDDKGREHVVTFKKIVLLTELYKNGAETREILYLPEDPQQVMFV